jgi:vacuolar protein sorting-associated protein 13A/C
VSSTTGSLAGVLSLMTGDKDFMKERGLRRRKKAKNVLQGFEQGASSLFNGVLDGITGVVTLPFKEVKSQGAIGILPGIFKGLTGIITKPLSGVFDTVSKTAEVDIG